MILANIRGHRAIYHKGKWHLTGPDKKQLKTELEFWTQLTRRELGPADGEPIVIIANRLESEWRAKVLKVVRPKYPKGTIH